MVVFISALPNSGGGGGLKPLDPYATLVHVCTVRLSGNLTIARISHVLDTRVQVALKIRALEKTAFTKDHKRK